MLHKAFTLIEILVVIALIGIVATVSVVSLSAGQGAAKLKGAARDAYAALRQARSIALVSQKPCVITFSTETRNEEAYSKIKITSAKLMNGIDISSAETIYGERISLEGAEDTTEAEQSGASGDGHSVEDVLFQDVSEDLLAGVRFYINGSGKGGEAESVGAEETRKASISVFSNVDFLLASYKKKTEENAGDESAENGGAGESESAAGSIVAASADTEPTSFVWQSNGRTSPQKIYVYLDGEKPEQGILIKIDKFGGISLISPEEDDER